MAILYKVKHIFTDNIYDNLLRASSVLNITIEPLPWHRRDIIDAILRHF